MLIRLSVMIVLGLGFVVARLFSGPSRGAFSVVIAILLYLLMLGILARMARDVGTNRFARHRNRIALLLTTGLVSFVLGTALVVLEILRLRSSGLLFAFAVVFLLAAQQYERVRKLE
jgi:hypothetical protein